MKTEVLERRSDGAPKVVIMTSEDADETYIVHRLHGLFNLNYHLKSDGIHSRHLHPSDTPTSPGARVILEFR
jgi:hypothetical protein